MRLVEIALNTYAVYIREADGSEVFWTVAHTTMELSEYLAQKIGE